MHDTPLLEDWVLPHPQKFNTWPPQEWTYVLDDGFLGFVNAAVTDRQDLLKPL